MPTLADMRGLPIIEELPEPIDGSYFVAAYPPFACWSQAAATHVQDRLNTRSHSANLPPLGLYVHIPFCADRCNYCYYRSYGGRNRHEWDQYCASLIEELALYHATAYIADREAKFVYFGGGTPSILTSGQIHSLLNKLKRLLRWDPAAEVTFECAPRSTNDQKLAVLRDHGVTRISLGVQQLDDRVLRQNGRRHLVAHVLRAYESIRQIGFQSVNLDLMVGLMGETDETFFHSLDQTIALQPDSITIYQLEIPHNTPLYRSLHEDRLDTPLVSWETKRDRLRAAFATLASNGYQLRSGYTAVRDCHHRFEYQVQQYLGCDLLGVGVSSFSYLGGIHFQNLADLERYQQAVASGELPLYRAYPLSAEEQMVREFVLQLKLGRVRRVYFIAKFATSPADRFRLQMEVAQRRGWLSTEDGDIVVTPEGLLRIDRILSAFYLPAHRPVEFAGSAPA